MAFSKVMMPHRPTLDRVAALHVLEATIKRSLEIAFVNQTIPLSDDDLEILSDNGIFPMGVGLGRTYGDRGFGSETGVIVHELRLAGKISPQDKVLDNFVAMMDHNNNPNQNGGYLRRQPYSINWIMRQAYRLGNDPSEVKFIFTDEEITRRVMHVVAVYLEANLRNGHVTLGVREQVMRAPAMQLLPAGKTPDEGPRNHQSPMTISRYVRDMFILELSEDEMIEKVKWFVRVHDRARERKSAAKKQVCAGGFDIFELSGYREVGTWVDSDDPYLLEELVENRPLVVMRSSKGNVIIMSKKFDLSGTARLFLNQERCWYYQASSQIQILANGTERVQDTPTGLRQDEIELGIGTTICYM